MEDIVLRVEKLNVGYLVTKGGGSAELKYAARTEPQLVDTILEPLGFRVLSLEVERIPSGKPPQYFPNIDEDPPLNNGTAQ